jgi:hypothetical protein
MGTIWERTMEWEGERMKGGEYDLRTLFTRILKKK